jgi:hypothetical protein
MGQILFEGATTTEAVPRAIQNSHARLRAGTRQCRTETTSTSLWMAGRTTSTVIIAMTTVRSN